MMLFDIKHKLYYEAINTSRPLMSLSHQGRTWGYVPKLLNGRRVKFWVDYTHGRYMYFEHDQKWYRVRYLQSNYKKQNHDIFNGVLIDLLTEGEELKLLKGKIEKDKRLLI